MPDVERNRGSKTLVAEAMLCRRWVGVKQLRSMRATEGMEPKPLLAGNRRESFEVVQCFVEAVEVCKRPGEDQLPVGPDRQQVGVGGLVQRHPLWAATFQGLPGK